MRDIDTAQWITFLTLVLGFALQIYRENRQRRWDQEDRAVLAQKVVKTAASLEAQVVGTAAILEAQVVGTAATLATAIEANTKISTDAFHEANTVNLKLQSLGIEANELKRRAGLVERTDKASP
jgi:hypothetical protein